MNIYTKGGDKGTTSLVHTKNVSKSDDRIQLVGTIYELTSHIGLVKSMLHIMLAAILLGTVGYLCAIFLTITASKAVMKVAGGGALSGRLFFGLIMLAVMRGIFHYAEQYCIHN